MADGRDDSFELYDLKVEVMAPAGAGNRQAPSRGDHFELRGEMLYLPPGQGFLIYSLAAGCLPPNSVRSTATTGCRPTARSPAPILTAHRA